MARLHLFEWEDQPWLPAILRDAGTGYLRKVAEITDQGRLLAPTIADALDRSGEDRIVDLCSGAGGPLGDIVEALGEDGREVRGLLTDLHPNETVLDRLCSTSEGRLDWRRQPLDATRVPADLPGLRTFFNGFHHLRPEAARGVLEDAAEARRPIAVIEVVSRHPAMMIGILFSTIASLFIVPFIRPMRLGFLPLTYLVPLVPLLILWDGMVSCLRTYSDAELEELCTGLDGGGYAWEIRKVSMGSAPAPATVLIGIPGAEPTAAGGG